MLLIPKLGKKPKMKPKRLAARRKFKEFGANPLKSYRRKYTDGQVWAMAEKARHQRLENPTPEELAFALGVKFIREKIFQNGDRFILADFFLPKWNLVVELDGAQHDFQKRYDPGRSMWLAREHAIKTVRFWNQSVLDGTAERRVREMLGLGGPECFKFETTREEVSSMK